MSYIINPYRFAADTANYTIATGPDGAAGVIDGDYKYHSFTSTKTGSNGFSVSQIGDSPNNTFEVLIVGGGGGSGTGGSAYHPGSGGAGGYYAIAAHSLSSGTDDYDVTVGDGGVANGNGSDSDFDWETASGGGCGGGDSWYPAADGGSGGGGSWKEPAGGFALDPAYGNDGADYGTGGQGAGGGGAGSAGGVGAATTPGDGVENDITGTLVEYAKGGGQFNGAGEDGKGEGGGALNTETPKSNPGGSGIVIIRYKFQ